MMKTRKPLAALVALLVTTPAIAAKDNPFGLDLDKHPAEYGCSQNQDNKFSYLCETVPKSHPEFEFYGIQYVEGIGTCFVKGVGKTIENDSYGITTKDRVDAIAKQLKPKYGIETDKIDLLLPGSIWDDFDDWMMGIRTKERVYAYSWNSEKGFKSVGEVAGIALTAKAISGYDGYVVLDFYFKREPQCEAVIEKDGQDSF